MSTIIPVNKRKILSDKVLSGISLKDKYFNVMCTYNKINDRLELVTLTSSTIGTTLIISSIATINPIMLIVSSVFCGVSTLTGSIQKGMNTKNKYESYRNTYLQLYNLTNEYTAKLIQNNLSSDEYDELTEHYNQLFNLIIESSLPIK